MDILSLVEDAKKEHLSFEKHPAIQLDIEQKTLYLNGLALLMNVDEEMHEKEKEYLTVLIRTFDLPDEKLNELIQFAKKPNKKAVLEIFDSFKEKDIKYVFMFDALMLAYKDEKFDPKEQKLIDDYFEALKISPREKEQVQYVYDKIIAQDKEALFRFFMQKDAIKRELYEYLLDYNGLGSKSPEEIEEKNKEVLIKIRNGLDLVLLEYDDLYYNRRKKILTKKTITNKQFSIFLQYLFDTNRIVFDDTLIKSTDGKTLFDLARASIKFENGVFEAGKEEPVKRISINGILKFIEWINSVSGDKFSIPEFESTSDRENYVYIISVTHKNFFNNELIFELRKKRYFISTKHSNENLYFGPSKGIQSFNKILDVFFRLQKKEEENES